jgi:hypothetical protein
MLRVIKKNVFVFALVFVSSFFISCISPEATHLLMVATAPEYNVSVEIKKGSAYISGIKNYNPEVENLYSHEIPPRDKLHSNYVEPRLVISGQKFSETLKYGWQVILTVQSSAGDELEIEVTDTDGKKKSYKISAPMNSKTFCFENHFRP